MELSMKKNSLSPQKYKETQMLYLIVPGTHARVHYRKFPNKNPGVYFLQTSDKGIVESLVMDTLVEFLANSDQNIWFRISKF